MLVIGVADGNYTKIGLYDATSDNLTWIENERWLGKLKMQRNGLLG